MFGSGAMSSRLSAASKKNEGDINLGHDTWQQRARLANTNYQNTLFNARRDSQNYLKDFYNQQMQQYQPWIQGGRDAAAKMAQWDQGGKEAYLNSQPVQAQLSATGQDMRRAANAQGRLYSGQDDAARQIMMARMGNELADSQYAKYAQQQALGAQFANNAASATGQVGNQLAANTTQYGMPMGEGWWNLGFGEGQNELNRRNALVNNRNYTVNAQNQATQAGWQNALGMIGAGTKLFTGLFPGGL